jgi:PPOX class probable F420-dependent enzyme
MFGVPGGGPNLDVVRAAEAAGLRFILAHGETTATIMAATSADLTGTPGAVVVTRGPGLASAVNGIAHAALDRLPATGRGAGGRAGPARSHRDRRRRRPGRIPGDHEPQPGSGRTQIGTRHRPGQPREGACAVSITVAKFRDVAEGVQPGQFMIGDREPVASLADLDPIYKRLLDEPVTAIVAVTGSDGQPNLTPVWFDYEGDTVLLNLATHRKKTGWLRKAPHATFLLMNPENTYHWLSLKTVVKREISEDDPAEGQRVTDQLDRIWVKYTGNEPPYALRDPSMDERRVLFELEVVKVATFGRP